MLLIITGMSGTDKTYIWQIPQEPIPSISRGTCILATAERSSSASSPRPGRRRPLGPLKPISGIPSDAACQSQPIVDRGMGVARRNGIADPEEPKTALGVALDSLRPALDERVVIDCAEVGRERLEVEV